MTDKEYDKTVFVLMTVAILVILMVFVVCEHILDMEAKCYSSCQEIEAIPDDEEGYYYIDKRNNHDRDEGYSNPFGVYPSDKVNLIPEMSNPFSY